MRLLSFAHAGRCGLEVITEHNGRICSRDFVRNMRHSPFELVRFHACCSGMAAARPAVRYTGNVIGRFLTGVKRFILWDYPRATWQYDVMVGLILAFIFLTPRGWFRDQPRVPQASRIVRLQAGHGTDVFWIEAELLAGVPEADRPRRAAELLRERAGLNAAKIRLEPVQDSESVLTGYLALTEP